jgi:hypothetical protein
MVNNTKRTMRSALDGGKGKENAGKGNRERRVRNDQGPTN